ncbi:MAG: hypothetical protein Q7U02_11190 [Desulfosalsimonadaceae bacterium]|nr:hypothetical protein [Desulfosalsimonadaceae bacterium]
MSTEPAVPEITMTNTKKEMLEAYEALKESLQNQARTELKPEKAQKVKEEEKIIRSAEKAVDKEDVTRRIYDLKDEIGRFLADLSGKIEAEKERYSQVKHAIDIRNRELMEIYEIEKSAFSLAALLEAQKQKKLEFEIEMAARRKEQEEIIESTKIRWEKEKQQSALAMKEQKDEAEKNWKRLKEEFDYSFNREKELKKQALVDELEKLTKQLQDKKEAFDKETALREAELAHRDTAVAEREKNIDALEQKAAGFPAELERQVAEAVARTTERLKFEADKNAEIQTGEFTGEKNVLKAKIESLDKLVASQQKQIDTLSRQIDTAYGKVQDIAVKAVSAKGAEYNMRPAKREQGEEA